MAQPRLPHYLRTYRRRHGFSQSEIAALLGATSDTKVSRYESFRRNPSVTTVFAYEIIFNIPVRDLFAGAYDDVHRNVRERARRLMKLLEREPARDPQTIRKIQMLRTIVESKPEAAESSRV